VYRERERERERAKDIYRTIFEMREMRGCMDITKN